MFNITSTKTSTEHATDAAAFIASRSEALLRMMVAEQNVMFQTFWRNDNCTPQEVADAFGPQCAYLFNRSAQLATFILSQDPTALVEADYTPPVPVTLNQDGTVTIG